MGRRRKIDKNCNEFANFCAENLHDLGGVGVARKFFALPNAALPQARTLRRSDTLPCCRECSQACSRVMTRADGLCKILWCLSKDRRVDTTRALTNVCQCIDQCMSMHVNVKTMPRIFRVALLFSSFQL